MLLWRMEFGGENGSFGALRLLRTTEIKLAFCILPVILSGVR